MTGESSAAPLEAFASRWVVALFALAGLIIGMVLFGLREPTYESRTIVSVNNPLGTMGDEAALVMSDRVLSPAAAALGFQPDIEVEPNEVADLLSITVRANDPDDAARAATQVAQSYVQSQTTVAVRIADPAEPNPSPVAPNRLAYVLIGTVVGALIGAAVGSLQTLGRLVPRRAEPVERPAPIRPARRPSSELASAMSAENAGQGERYEPGPTGITEMPSASSESVVDLRMVAPVSDGSRPEPSTPAVAPAPAPAPRRPAATAFSSASSSMVDTPSRPTPTWRTGEVPVASEPSSPDASTPPVHTPAPQPLAAEEPQPTPAPPVAQSVPIGFDESDAESFFVEAPPAAVHEVKPTGYIETGPTFEEHDLDHDDLGDGPTFSDEPIFENEPAPARVRPSAIARRAQSPSPDSIEAVRDLEDIEAHYETLLNDQAMGHAETLSSVEADFERDLSDLKRLLADARKQARIAAAQIKRMSGDDQHRIGDLEAQATALEAEITTLRGQLESERIGHVRELTTERDAADRALDNARREFRSRLDAHENDSRRAMSDSRGELDELLAKARFEHQTALERQHQEYEEALARDRERHKADLARLAERHREDITKTRTQAEEGGERQARQIKQTLAELRATEKRLTTELGELHQADRQFRAELTTARKNHRYTQQKHAETEQSLRDELALTKKSLQSEKERNAALRDDVVRRTAEAHQAVDRAIDDRSAKLTELEALVARQREHAEQRVREANAAAEERARAGARREAELSARITRLERELDQVRPKTG